MRTRKSLTKVISSNRLSDKADAVLYVDEEGAFRNTLIGHTLLMSSRLLAFATGTTS
jgi:hypothetical protein